VATRFESVDDYMASLPDGSRAVLEQVRATLREAAPTAAETISYNIPALELGGKPLVYFSGWKQHVSLYPIPQGDAAFEQAIGPHRAGKGTLKFALDQPLPTDLLNQIVALHLQRLSK
jgi:uncharacterized protein YdhG (YjbR/CyaY superfamily)